MNTSKILAAVGRLHPGYRIYGPYGSADRRKYIVFHKLVNGRVKRSRCHSMSWARAKMIAKLNRRLKPYEEVDHKDADCSNDHYSNLQVLHVREHRRKTGQENSSRSTRTMEKCPILQDTLRMPSV